ncbi:MAG: 4Fe-4S dicluster domain-containing protein [Candidatus Hodarchaeota archaeon]
MALEFNRRAESSKSWGWDFYKQLVKKGLPDVFAKCYQCGKCVGLCPAAQHSAYNMRKIVRNVLFGQSRELLDGNEIWYCFDCYNCKLHCPHGIELPKLIHTLRSEAIQRGLGCDNVKMFIRFGKRMLETGATTRMDERIRSIRKSLGLPEKVISEKAIKELNVIAKATKFDEQLERCRFFVEHIPVKKKGE